MKKIMPQVVSKGTWWELADGSFVQVVDIIINGKGERNTLVFLKEEKMRKVSRTNLSHFRRLMFADYHYINY